MQKLLPLLGLLAVSGCASEPKYVMTNRFDAHEVAWASAAGSNTIAGTAKLLNTGAESKTCAGQQVVLTPESAYTREHFTAVYGSPEAGYRPISGWGPKGLFPKVIGVDKNYMATSKATFCDQLGAFTFGGLADGNWFVEATVRWDGFAGLPSNRQGGTLMRRVSVKGGQVVSVTMQEGLS